MNRSIHIPGMLLRGPRTQAGLTLIEMMTALVIGSVLLAGLTQVFVASRQGYKLSESQAYLQEAGRLATSLIVEDLRRAGYWGGNADVTRFSDGTTTPVVPTDDNYNACVDTDSSWGTMLQQRVFGLDDTASGYAGATNCIPTSGTGSRLATGGDIVVARYADSSPVMEDSNPIPNHTNTRLYVRSSLFSGRLFTGANQGDTQNTVPTKEAPWADYPLVANAYYVGETGNTCDDEPIPALFRVPLSNTGGPGDPQDLVAGVQDLQVKWGLDVDGNGAPDRWVDADDAAVSSAAPWNWTGYAPRTNKVVSARIWILARAECPDPTYTSDQEFVYGNYTTSAPYQPGDHYRRQLYTATVTLRN